MAHSNCGKRIKLSYIDLNSRINKYHTGVVRFQRALSPLTTDWASFLSEKSVFCSNILFFAAPDAVLQIFSVVNVNSILSLTQIK